MKKLHQMVIITLTFTKLRYAFSCKGRRHWSVKGYGLESNGSGWFGSNFFHPFLPSSSADSTAKKSFPIPLFNLRTKDERNYVCSSVYLSTTNHTSSPSSSYILPLDHPVIPSLLLFFIPALAPYFCFLIPQSPFSPPRFSLFYLLMLLFLLPILHLY